MRKEIPAQRILGEDDPNSLLIRRWNRVMSEKNSATSENRSPFMFKTSPGLNQVRDQPKRQDGAGDDDGAAIGNNTMERSLSNDEQRRVRGDTKHFRGGKSASPRIIAGGLLRRGKTRGERVNTSSIRRVRKDIERPGVDTQAGATAKAPEGADLKSSPLAESDIRGLAFAAFLDACGRHGLSLAMQDDGDSYAGEIARRAGRAFARSIAKVIDGKASTWSLSCGLNGSTEAGLVECSWQSVNENEACSTFGASRLSTSDISQTSQGKTIDSLDNRDLWELASPAQRAFWNTNGGKASLEVFRQMFETPDGWCANTSKGNKTSKLSRDTDENEALSVSLLCARAAGCFCALHYTFTQLRLSGGHIETECPFSTSNRKSGFELRKGSAAWGAHYGNPGEPDEANKAMHDGQAARHNTVRTTTREPAAENTDTSLLSVPPGRMVVRFYRHDMKLISRLSKAASVTENATSSTEPSEPCRIPMVEKKSRETAPSTFHP